MDISYGALIYGPLRAGTLRFRSKLLISTIRCSSKVVVKKEQCVEPVGAARNKKEILWKLLKQERR